MGDARRITERASYGQLDALGRRLAMGLRASGIQSGDRVLLMFEPGLGFVRGLWACLYAGAVAVPVPAPDSLRRARTVPRLRAIAADCRASAVLTSARCAELLTGEAPLGAATILELEGLGGSADEWTEPAVGDTDMAILQYTSGSTRAPRGVTLSHANLAHNLDMLRSFHGDQEHMTLLHWLPLFHDMGLIRGLLSPLHMAGDCIMFSAMDFVQRPVRWLRAAGTISATTIGAPSFAFALCAERITEAERADLDLSAIEVAFCSSEPIRASSIDRFLSRFAGVGLSRSAFRASYGLAEATVMVAGDHHGGLATVTADRDALQAGRYQAAASGVELAVCGTFAGGQQGLIVSVGAEPVGEGVVGEIWLSGPSVASGYWNRPEDSERVFGARLADGRGPFLRTGDLGFMVDGRLVVTGRIDDLIIIHGQNIYPQDLEAAAEEASAAVRRGSAAAYALGDGESVGIALESRADPGELGSLVGAVRAAIGLASGVRLGEIAILAPGTMPKTASGKIQRSAARKRVAVGSAGVLHHWIAPAR